MTSGQNDETRFGEDQTSYLNDNAIVTLGGIITNINNKYTKNNNIMAFLTLEDLYGEIEVIVFPQVYTRYRTLLEPDNPVIIEGRISLKEDEEPKLICNKIEPLVNNKPSKLYLMISKNQKPGIEREVYKIIRRYKGNIPVYLYFEAAKKTFRARPDTWVRRDSGLVDELNHLLGEKCVKML